MAVLRLSGLVTRISGKQGGSVFVKTQYGQVVKNNSYSLPQRSTAQLIQQSKIQFVSSRWLLLTEAEKMDWQNQTVNYPFENKVGDVVFYNGYALFLMLNNNLKVIDAPINLLVPVFVDVPAGLILSNTLTSLVFLINYVGGSVGQTVVVYASVSYNFGQTPKKTNNKQIYSTPILVGNQVLDLYTSYVNVFGVPVVGKCISFFCKAVHTVSGNKSNDTPMLENVVTI